MRGSNRHHIKRQTFPEMFDTVVFKYADCTCQMWKDETGGVKSVTYDQVGRIVKELTAGLIFLGVKKQDRVAIMSDNCPQWLWADFSILNAGGITVTMYPSLSEREMAFIINSSGAKIIYVEDEVNLNKALNMWYEMPQLEKIIVLKGTTKQEHPNVISLEDLTKLGGRTLSMYSSIYEDRWRSVQLHDKMTIIYTSGTTGRQKGVVHTHFSVNAAVARDLRISPAYSENDVFISLLTLSHSYERQCGQMIALSAGASIAYTTDHTNMLHDYQLFKPTMSNSVPRLLERLYLDLRKAASEWEGGAAAFDEAIEVGLKVVEAKTDGLGYSDFLEGTDFTAGLDPDLKQKYQDANERVLSKVKQLLGGRFRFSFSGAGVLPPNLCRFYMALGIRIIDGYGLVEACNTVAQNYSPMLPGSVGRLVPGIEGKIAGDGELLVKGDCLFCEYWNNEKLTREAFTEEGFFKTGDIVMQLPGGYIKIVDRKKDLIVLDSGEKVSVSKVENLFCLSRFISRVFIVGDGRRFVTALVVPNFDTFIKYFDKHGILYNQSALQYSNSDIGITCIKVGPDFVAHSALRTIIDTEISKANQQLEDFEKIEKYHVLNRDFSEIAREVTPTLKLRRDVIHKYFSVEMDQLYD